MSHNQAGNTTDDVWAAREPAAVSLSALGSYSGAAVPLAPEEDEVYAGSLQCGAGKSLSTPPQVEPEEEGEAACHGARAGAADGDLAGVPQQHSPLHCIAHFFNRIIPRGGVLSGALNLASVTFGAGIMSFPSAFNTAGMVMGVIYLVAVTSFTVFSIYLLARASEKTGLTAFESLARSLFGTGGDVFVACIMWLLCFGGAVGFVVAVGDIFTAIFSASGGAPEFLRSSSGRRCMQAAVWLFFMLPVSMPKKINSLRYVSAVGIFFVVFFIFCVVGHCAHNGLRDGIRKDLVMVQTGNNAVSAVSLFMFGYLNQVNSLGVMRESTRPTTGRMTLTAALSCGVCAVLYFLIGFFGYADLGPEVTSNILLYYDPFRYPIFFVCYVGLVVKLVASFAQNMFACRTALFQVVRWEVETMPYWKHSLFAGLFATGALILGLFVPDINIVFGLVGSFCGGFIAFIFPALFYMYTGGFNIRSVGVVKWTATYVLLVAGVVGLVFGTVATVYSTVQKYS